MPRGFDNDILEHLPELSKPLLVFGGLSEPAQFRDVLSRSNVVAAGAGNFFSYKEHAIQLIKQSLVGLPIRAAFYKEELFP